KQHLAESSGSRPFQQGLDQQVTDTAAPETWVDPHRGHPGRAARFAGTPADCARHLTIDLGDESRPIFQALPPPALRDIDLARVAGTVCVWRLFEGGKANAAVELSILRRQPPHANSRGQTPSAPSSPRWRSPHRSRPRATASGSAA